MQGEELEQLFLSLRHDINPKSLVPQEGSSSDTDGEAGGQLVAVAFSAAHGLQG